MAATPASVLAINAGSSSIKFALYQAGRAADAITTWTARPNWPGRNDAIVDDEQRIGRAAAGRVETAKPPTGLLIDWLETQNVFGSISAVGHRLVHGLARTEPAQITSDVLAELHRATPYAPDHLPREIELIEALRARYPELAQVACFDTAFHGAHATGRQAAADSAAVLRRRASGGTGFMACPTHT